MQVNSSSRSNIKQYSKTNAYTQRPSIEQILTVFLFVVHFAMHCIFLIRPIVEINHPVLYVSWVLFYCLLVVMAVDYCIITCGDPVDLALVDEVEMTHYRFQNSQFRKSMPPRMHDTAQNPYRIRYCEQCLHSVKYSSYHCWRCGRCVEGMDHHCKYLNNCIGARNYTPFFRMLITTTIYLLLSVMHCIWVFVTSYSSQTIKELCFNRWAVMVLLIFSVGLIIAVDSLLCFHFYISCFRKMTTIEYLFRQTASNVPSSITQVSEEDLERNRKKKNKKRNHQQSESAHDIVNRNAAEQGNDSQQMVQKEMKTPSPSIPNRNMELKAPPNQFVE